MPWGTGLLRKGNRDSEAHNSNATEGDAEEKRIGQAQVRRCVGSLRDAIQSFPFELLRCFDG